jgi:hypothetical protein
VRASGTGDGAVIGFGESAKDGGTEKLGDTVTIGLVTPWLGEGDGLRITPGEDAAGRGDKLGLEMP